MTTRTRVETLDVGFLGQPGVVACGLLADGDTIALVDPGPASSLPGLERALGAEGAALADVHAILITHIHLDHSGAAGVIARTHPRVRVYVHERGAPHVIDPSRLVQSAGRLYGEEMDRLWGEVAPVAAERVQALRGGERLRIGTLSLEVAATPGHAWHHVSYFHEATGTAFVGDTGGIRVPGVFEVMPPTPPPDIDLEAWEASIARIRAWRPSALFLTHFGAFPDADLHLDTLLARLRRLGDIVRASLERDEDDEARIARFRAEVTADLRRHLPLPLAERYEMAVPLDHCWLGLARYWRKRRA
jgi:glyoxylase-like metal-dependent hydrolase (beta-lactamase superfamily II)